MRMIVGQSNFFFLSSNQHMSTALPLQFVILCDHFVYSRALQGHSKDTCWSSKAMRLDKYHMWLMWILGNNCSWMRYLKWGESSWHFQSRKQNPLYVQDVFVEPWEACGNLVSNVRGANDCHTFHIPQTSAGLSYTEPCLQSCEAPFNALFTCRHKAKGKKKKKKHKSR